MTVRLVTTLLLGLLAVACRTEMPRPLDELSLVDSVYVDSSTGLPFTGPVERRFDDDTTSVQIAGVLLGGVWDGEMIVYHPNGRVRYMGSFAVGERCGPWVENADSAPTANAYEDLVREVETLGLYPPCDGSS
jgi:hypothetical protein